MNQLSLGVEAGQGAIFGGPSQEYRYALWRTWDPTLPRALFIMLNPSTADEHQDDPTVRRCIGYARAWRYGGLTVCNIFALRSTDPSVLYEHPDPIGPENNTHILGEASSHTIVVCAWGAHGALRDRGRAVRALLAGDLSRCKLHHLGLTKAGHPRHPLYLAGSLLPSRFGDPP